MLKKAMLLFGFVLMVSSFTYAEDKYSISGQVYFERDSPIYMNLLTKETFQKPNRREAHPPPFGICINLTTEQVKSKKVPFKFVGIPKGNYFVLAFQDFNENKKLDRHYDGSAAEPVGTYKKSNFMA
jgi:hypothetical protein